MKIITIFTFCLLCLISCHNNEPKNLIRDNVKSSSALRRNYTIKNLRGDWEPDCEKLDGYIEIPKTFDTARVGVTLNQIDIAASIKIDSNDNKMILSFTLSKPTDLGAGGGRLDWDHFSRDSVIIRMDFIDSAKAKLTWFGFYNKKTKRRFWKDGFDMLDNDSTKNEVLVYKCSHPMFKQ